MTTKPLDTIALMKVVMKADEETRGFALRGTTNWAAHIGKAVQDAVLVASPWNPASKPPPEEAGEVLVLMQDGSHEIAWATYWHGASRDFACWTFRDPDETESPVAWMLIPKKEP
ncbi:MAG: hypothetical protein WBI92_11745 [Cloacibacterium sp.]|uniref:hypothetical protein n=1 Tax=Cloacibacterium sp. TaxID=1913682 RepID=UPI003C7655F0